MKTAGKFCFIFKKIRKMNPRKTRTTGLLRNANRSVKGNDRLKDAIYETKDTFRLWMWVLIFSVAFAWIESAIVVYLWKIYFDGVFKFPLIILWKEGKHVVDPLVRIEFGREIATIVLLVSIGWVAGRNKLQKVCFFMIAFGLWDLFYYIWLYIMVGRPESLMAWDLLFYVPLPGYSIMLHDSSVLP